MFGGLSWEIYLRFSFRDGLINVVLMESVIVRECVVVRAVVDFVVVIVSIGRPSPWAEADL